MALFDGLDDRCTRGKTNVLVWAGTSALGAFVNLLAFFAAIDIYLKGYDAILYKGLILEELPCNERPHERDEQEDFQEIEEVLSTGRLAIVTIALTLIICSISCFWSFQMHAGKCGESPATTEDVDVDENPVANDDGDNTGSAEGAGGAEGDGGDAGENNADRKTICDALSNTAKTLAKKDYSLGQQVRDNWDHLLLQAN
jgi:hypothetical protein